jgi:hypothetical protein
MAERLLSPSRVLLYGRVVEDLQVGFRPGAVPPEPVPASGANTFLQNQLAGAGAQFARIYGFCYEGHYYDLAKPALFLVHGAGVAADPPGAGAGAPNRRVARAPAEVDHSGIGATATSFPDDMMVWAYDKGDFSIRMDIETGPLDQILLEAELSNERLKMAFGGQHARLRTPGGGGPSD